MSKTPAAAGVLLANVESRVKSLYDWPSEVEFAVISPITYANLHGATHGNPATYQVGTTVTFTPPSGRTGYTFTGWSPAAITADMTGAQTVTASWQANAYQIVYDANDGSGLMADLPMTYDEEKPLPTCAFTRTGYTFAGWATSAGGAVKYADGATVKNLASSGTVTLYAVWKTNYVVAINANGGGGTMARQTFDLGHVYNLPKCTLTPPAGKSRFAGWACSNGRRYDDEMLVFDLGDVTITAIWE